MYAVATSHDDNSFGRSEHVITADGAVALSGTLDATMSVLDRHGKTNRARLQLLVS